MSCSRHIFNCCIFFLTRHTLCMNAGLVWTRRGICSRCALVTPLGLESLSFTSHFMQLTTACSYIQYLRCWSSFPYSCGQHEWLCHVDWLQGYMGDVPCPHWIASAALRTLLVAGSASIALLVPFFAYLMSLIGAASSMTVCVVLPCICYGKLMKDKLCIAQWLLLGATCSFGSALACIGTYGAIMRIHHAGGSGWHCNACWYQSIECRMCIVPIDIL